TTLIENQTISIKHKFILSSDEVAIGNDYGIVRRARGQHGFSPAAFASVVRRRRDINNDFSAARECLLKDRPVRIPDVFADAYADRRAIQLKNRTSIAGLEISKFIEYAIVRQIDFVVRRYQ